MHKHFYASGFLFHGGTEQILLQQVETNDTSTLTFFRAKSRKKDMLRTVFQRCVQKTLGIPIADASIRPVYDYVHENLEEHYIFYVEMKHVTPTTKNTAWFPLSKLAKQPMSEQTRHDIIVGIRVIGATLYSSNPLKSPT